jgi:hypothetical protein
MVVCVGEKQKACWVLFRRSVQGKSIRAFSSMMERNNIASDLYFLFPLTSSFHLGPAQS